jgi:hypothetical protein
LMSPVRASSSARRRDQFSGFQSNVIAFDYAGSRVVSPQCRAIPEKTAIPNSFSIISIS